MNDRHDIIICFTKLINFIQQRRIEETDEERKKLLDATYVCLLEAYDDFLKTELIS